MKSRTEGKEEKEYIGENQERRMEDRMKTLVNVWLRNQEYWRTIPVNS